MDQVNYYEKKLAFETDGWDLKVMLDSGSNVIVVDARAPSAYDVEHIPGAVSIPHRSMSAESTAHLDRSALIVTYCDGIGCNASTKGALAMARLGFTVKELLGGLDWWKRDGHPTSVGGQVAGPAEGCDCG